MTDASVDRSEAADAAARVARRRRQHSDDDLEFLGATEWDVASHVARRQQVDPAVLREEVPDAFALIDFLRRELDRMELGVWRAAEKGGFSFRELAELRGLNSRQAAEQRRRRLEAFAAGDDKREPAARARRRGRARPRSEATAGSARDAQVRDLVEQLVASASLVPEDCTEDVDDLAAALRWWRSGDPTPAEVLDDLRILVVTARGCHLADPIRTLLDLVEQTIGGH